MRILLAEDNPASRMLLESYLKKWGYNVVTCVNGKEALEILGQEDAPEIAILDWLMPDIDGIEVCRTVRTSKQSLLPYLIFVTAKSSEQDLAEGLQQGADDYLVKPVGELELRARIQVGLRVVSMWKRLIEAERNRVLMETAGAAAHEINNPFGDFGSKKYLVASLDQSLRRMGLEYVDIFYHHRPDPETPLEETMGALDQIVKQGKALYAGVSNYGGALTTEAHGILKGMGTRLLINQVAYSMLRRGVEGDLLPPAGELGVGVIAFVPLSQGMLTNKYLEGIPADSRAARPEGTLQEGAVKPEIVDQVRQLNEIAKERGQSMAQMALIWVLRDERVRSALIGASRVEQIEENVAALEQADFSAEELAKIEGILAE